MKDVLMLSIYRGPGGEEHVEEHQVDLIYHHLAREPAVDLKPGTEKVTYLAESRIMAVILLFTRKL